MRMSALWAWTRRTILPAKQMHRAISIFDHGSWTAFRTEDFKWPSIPQGCSYDKDVLLHKSQVGINSPTQFRRGESTLGEHAKNSWNGRHTAADKYYGLLSSKRSVSLGRTPNFTQRAKTRFSSSFVGIMSFALLRSFPKLCNLDVARCVLGLM
jgi:hypothetical protein